MHPARARRSSNALIVTAVAALVGGTLAALIGSGHGPATWVLLVTGATVLATAVAMLVLTARTAPQAPPRAPRPPGRNDWHQQPQQGSIPQPGNANFSRPAVPQTTPGVQVVPLEEGLRPPGSGSRDWWTKSGPAVPPANDHRQPAPELASYVASGAAFVAQCPHCGDFRIDVRRSEPAHSFRCRNPNCGAQWQWTPGTPWPPVVVRRNLTARQPGLDGR
jgi:hypothetical protein